MANEMTMRLSLQTPPTEDNAGAAYQQVAENRAAVALESEFRALLDESPVTPAAPSGGGSTPAQSGNPDFDALMSGGNEGNNPAATAQGEDAPLPVEYIRADTPKEQPGTKDPNASLMDQVMGWARSIGGDIGTGAKEAPRQFVGGVIDAFGEMDQFMQQAIPIGGLQLFDDAGNFDPSFISSAEMLANEKANEDLFSMIAPDKADSVTGGFVRATSQFLTGFLPGLQATKGMQAMRGGTMLSNMAAGAIADMVVFDPNEDRLSTFLNQIPALASIVPDFLADNAPDQSHWEGRLKNAIEGAGLGLATDGLLSAFKYYKAARKAKAETRAAADPLGATVEAAKDELKAAARTELVQDIPDEALRPLGDAAPEAPLLVEAPANENATQAFSRIADARTRALQADKDMAALDQVNSIRERFAKAKGMPEGGRDPMDEMLDELRSGAVTNAKIPKRPIADIVKSLGGIDPTSSLAAELRGRGVTPQKFPGMFKKGGRKSLDNVPASEHEIFAGRTKPDAAGYIEQQSFIDGLEAELKGEPWMTADTKKTFDEVISPLDDLEVELDRMGIDYRTMSNERVKERIKEIQDAPGFATRDTGQDALFSSPRTLEDIEKEAREQAIAQGRDPEIAAADAVKPKVYINHARINSADDVRAVIQQMADLDAGNITDKTRGVVSNEQTIKESSREYRDLNDLIGRAPGPMTAAQATAARRALASSGEQIVQLAKIAQAPGASPADIFNFRRAMAVHYALQSEVIAARTETARALQAWSIPVGASKARSAAIADLIAQQGGAGDLQALAKAVSMVGDNPTALNTMARELGRGRFGAALYQVWINGLLSSPKTHAVNILSNAMTSLYAIPERYMAAGISKAFYNGDIATGEAAAQAFGLVKGIRDGIRLVYMGNKADGADGLSDVFDAFVKIEGTHQNAISADALGLRPEGSLGYGIDMLGKIVNAPGSALNAEDKFFKTIAYRMELNSLAYRQAASEGLEGKEAAERMIDILQNPPDTLKADAMDMAHYQTFTNNLSPGARQALGGIAKTPVVGPVFKLVVPFVKTPTNILKYTFERTPLAYASASIRADIAAGGARAAQAHARVALGSMIFLTVMDMASEGSITGAGPLSNDMDKTQALRRGLAGAGAPPPYSIKVGDRWYAYNRLDPIGMLMGMGADMAETFGSAEDADSELLAGAGVLAIAQNLASKSYLSGVFDFLGAMDPNNVTSDPGKYLSDFATGLVPYSSFLRNTATAFDPIARDAKAVVYGDDLKVDPIATYWQATIDKVKRGIPGLSDELPPMRDLWGDPIDRSSGIGWGWDFVSPIASKADNPDPVTKEIIDNRISISFPDRNIEGVRLTPAQYDQYMEIAGKGAKAYLDDLVKQPTFQQMSPGPDGMKAEIIKNVINGFREQARGQLMMRDPDLRDRMIEVQRDKMKTLTGN